MSAEPEPAAAPATGSVAIAGVGAMGGAMAECLLRKGFRVFVRDVVPERVDALARRGAMPAASCAELARAAGIVMTVVVDATQTDAVLFGEGGDGNDPGVVATAKAGTIVVMCSTVAPAYTAALAKRLAAHGIALIDAPISGGPQRARDGTLSMMVAAPDEIAAQAAHVLAAVAARAFRVGTRAGDGSAMKLVNNMLAGVNLAAGAEALVLAEKLGMDLALVCDVVNASSGGSWIFGDRMPRALAGDYAPRAATRILTKDLGLALDVATQAGVAANVARAARQAYLGALAHGLGEDDDAAMVEYYRVLARRA